MDIRLLVVRTGAPQQLSEFYSLLGLSFEYHRHGQSPYHYSTTIGTTILEIYPLAKGQTEADKHLRLGFEIDNFEAIIGTLRQADVHFFNEPAHTDYGYMAVIADPDGRKVELYQK
jgi:catechol 2,3-dioxygenase-like lactoylglutathione lyase family enzyme